MNTLRIAAFVFPLLLALDLFWVGGIAHDFYQAQLGGFLTKDVVWPPALLFYVLYSVALAFFAIKPAYDAGSLKSAVLRGAFFGLITYAGYDLVNLATLGGWPVPLSVVDLLYGAVMSAAVCACAFWIANRTLRR